MSDHSAAAGVPEHSDRSQVLTHRQRMILQFINEFVQKHGYPPSLREIAAAAGLKSKSSVWHQLSILEKKGCLSRDAGRPRTVMLRAPSHTTVRPGAQPNKTDRFTNLRSQDKATYVPLVGRIAAGYLMAAEEYVEEGFSLPNELVGDGELFMLKVSGDSMINAGIFEGDLVVVRRQPVVENGEFAVAMIDGETTVKTYMQTDGHVWLMPHNPFYTPIPGDNAVILGKVVTVIRRV
jgi:repressor LexA